MRVLPALLPTRFLFPEIINPIERGPAGLFDILNRCPGQPPSALAGGVAVPALSPDPARKEQP
jgi:hypothetical protein